MRFCACSRTGENLFYFLRKDFQFQLHIYFLESGLSGWNFDSELQEVHDIQEGFQCHCSTPSAGACKRRIIL